MRQGIVEFEIEVLIEEEGKLGALLKLDLVVI